MHKLLLILFSIVCLAAASCFSNSNTVLAPGMREQAAKINVALGNTYLSENDNDLAKAKFLKALALDPNLGEVHAGLGAYYAHVNETALAEQEYQRALNLSPHDATIIAAYANFLCKVDQDQAALNYFHRALAEPKNVAMAQTYTDAGNCAITAHDDVLAQTYFNKAILQNSSNPTAYFALASLAYQDKNYAAAKRYLNTFNAQSEATEGSIKLGIAIYAATGDHDKAASQRLLLQARFPALGS